MLLLDVLSRFIHIFTAITLVGGSVFTVFVLLPSANELPDQERTALTGSTSARWKRFVHGGILLFLLSGFYNYYRAIPEHKGDGLYHALVGTKMILALTVFFIASALVGRSEKLEPLRRSKAKWLKVLLTLATIVVMISSFLKVSS